MKYDPLAYECNKCCLACDEDQKTCKYKKARGRLVNRMVYAAKKEKRDKENFEKGNKYRVEFRVDKKDYFRKDCFEDKLIETKDLVKAMQREEDKGKCFYRKFPVTKNKKVYF